MRRLRTHLSFANVMSCVAVSIALGGVSYAAIAIPRNSVRSAQIKDKQVKKRDLAKGAVSSAKVADGSLLAKDFRSGELAGGAGGANGASGSAGPPGARGADGVPGAPGPAGRDGAALAHTVLYTGNYTPPLNTFAPVPVANATWTQPANALDYFFARVRIIRNVPNQCDGAGEDLEIQLRLDGQNGSLQPVRLPTESGTYVIGFKPPYSWLVPPGVDTQHTVEALAKSYCVEPFANRWRIQELRIDVVRAVGG